MRFELGGPGGLHLKNAAQAYDQNNTAAQ